MKTIGKIVSHTPAPWKFSADEHKVRISADRHYVHECIYFADVFQMTGDGGYEESIANAKLIAAAPDLLAALIQIKKLADYENSKIECLLYSKFAELAEDAIAGAVL